VEVGIAKLHKLHPSPKSIMLTKSKTMRWRGKLSCIKNLKNICILVQRLKKTLRPKHRWDVSIKVQFKRIDCVT
jgi:hypothetical protein